MILVEAGGRDARAFEGKVLFAQLLAARGHRVAIDADTLPERVGRPLRYELANLLCDLDDKTPEAAVVVGAERLAEPSLSRLRQLFGDTDAPVHALGRFETAQSEIHARTRLAYALGREPNVIELARTLRGQDPLDVTAPLVFARAAAVDPQNPVRLTLVLTNDLVAAPSTLPLLAAIDHMPGLSLSVIMSGKSKDELRKSRHMALSVNHFGELPPTILCRSTDVVAFCGETVAGERMVQFAAQMIGAGKPVIDATVGALLQASGMPVLVGSTELGALPHYVTGTVVPNAQEIGRSALASEWAESRDIARLEAKMSLHPPEAAQAPPPSPRTVFFPTNGHGLGHARRCALIASEMDRRDTVIFTAFPSCLSMIEARGFPVLPLVPRSTTHPEPYASDLITLRRFSRLVTGADHLVFDGGHVFDSVVHTVLDTGCRATWIRRGLFRVEQLSAIQVDREAVFDQIIAPRECFDELNSEELFRPRLKTVGPVVDTPDGIDPAAQRAMLAETFETQFDTLVVTMLGSGVSSDRSAQLNALCLQLEHRPRLLHLVVVWPGSEVAPLLFQWSSTRVVRTLSSIDLCAAADFVVSAAGYNSFHELLYNGIPAIFVPQVALEIDDQMRRATAAAERDLALCVAPDNFLTLERSVSDWLDGDGPAEIRKALRDADLPPRGNADAARLIEGSAG